MVVFDKETHTYTLDGKNLISTTQLLSKFSLAPSYSAVNQEKLRLASEYGSLVHEEIENYIKEGKTGLTAELDEFIEYLSKNPSIRALQSETMVNNDIVAGTIDLIFENNGKTYIADFKTTSTIHTQTVAWQLSIYAYLYDKENYENISIQVFHFEPELRVVDLQLKPRVEVERLMECQRTGNNYLESSDLLPSALQYDLKEVENKFTTLEEEYKKLKAVRDELLAKVKQVMEESGTTTVSTESFKITYVAPQTREGIDTKKFIEEHPRLAKKYKTTTQVKSSIRITLKKEKAKNE
jgi:hypothetical protein